MYEPGLSQSVLLGLDPGIRDVVIALHRHGFITTDSGDGVSKPPSDEVLPFRHVYCQVQWIEFRDEVTRMQLLLDQGKLPTGKWVVEGICRPATRTALIFLYEMYGHDDNGNL